MADSYLQLLIDIVNNIEARSELPPSYIDKLKSKITRLEPVESEYFDPDTKRYSLDWAKKMEELEAEIAFYRYLFNNAKFIKTIKIIATGEYEPITEFKDEIRELMVLNYVSASREYKLIDDILYNFKKDYFMPAFERRIINKYFLTNFYHNLEEYFIDVLEFRVPGALDGNKEKLKSNIQRFRDAHPLESYIEKVIPTNRG